MNVAILTLSDKGSRGEREDQSGPALAKWLKDRGHHIGQAYILPDNEDSIALTLAEWADSGLYDLILTTGGTGVSPRDVTPDATARTITRLLPGFGEEMRRKSLDKTPMAIISRGIAGIRGETLIINLPGSPKGAVENIEAVWEAVPHTIDKIKGDEKDCSAE